MDGAIKTLEWDAYEHNHGEKNGTWFFVLTLITVSGSALTILLGNMLFGLLILIAGAIVAILSMRSPRIITYAITQRGLRVDDKLYPYTTLESYAIDDQSKETAQLLVKSSKLFMPLIIIPLPEEHVDDIEDIVAGRLPEEHLEEPFANKVLEFFGF